jgi:hypothetical protein
MDFDFCFEDLNFGATTGKKKKKVVCSECKKEVKPSAYTRKSANIYRKAYSELKLFDLMPTEFNENDVTHIISGGDIDSLSFLQYMIRFQSFKYVILSTWCMAKDDILIMDKWFDEGKVGRYDFYVGEIFPNQYLDEYVLLKRLADKVAGRVCIFRNHSKVFAVKGEKFDFIIESSANVNTNPRAENTVVTIGTEGYNFYKDYFDNITSFKKDFENWRAF